MRIFSQAFHTSYQYSLAAAFPEIDWYFVNGSWSPNRPKPPNVHEHSDRDTHSYDLWLTHGPDQYDDMRAMLASHGIPARRLVYISHWSYNPEAWWHQARSKPLAQFRHEVADSPIVAVSHFMIQDFEFFSHIACEAIPHYVPAHLFSDVEWRGHGDSYINIVNDFFAPLRGTGVDFWRSIQGIVPTKLFGNGNGSEGVGGLNSVESFKETAAAAKAYLWTGEKVAMSYAPLEAIACGCPVIAPDNMDWSKLFKDGHDVMLYRQGDVESLRAALNRYEGDETLRKALSANGRKTVEDKFGLAQFRAKWARAIDGAMADW